MKKLLLFFSIVFIVVLGIISHSEAIPYCYTFEGQIGIIDDDLGLAAELGLTTQTRVSYTFLADFEKPGIIVNPDGTIDQRADTSTHDLFFAELTSESILLGDDISIFDGLGSTKRYSGGNIIFPSTSTIGGSMGIYFVNSTENDSRLLITLSKSHKFANDWIVGDTLTGFESFRVGGLKTRIDFSLEINSITPAPVPEPSTILLVATGLIGLVGFRKKFKK